MKQDYPRLGIASLCRLFGKTRHAYYDHGWRVQDAGLKDEMVLQHVLGIRAQLPRIGTLKLHQMMAKLLETHQIKIGRDYLFDLMREHNLHIRRRKRMVVTTNSRHWMRKYCNLVKDMEVHRPEQLWVSDITYIRLTNQWGYLSLITDAYSRKIMGYCFRSDLSALGCIDALKMALKARQYPNEKIIHHSDRGSQYCSKSYVDLLVTAGIAISMTENGDPYENALAERVNGIIKSEFNLYHSALGMVKTSEKISQSIQLYNNLRPHSSCDFLTPQMAHLKTGVLKKRWKKRNYKVYEKTLV
jgi:transposase InsO family protein